jgi:prepilin-type N-terminal cleavage/methylation domain-containing protein
MNVEVGPVATPARPAFQRWRQSRCRDGGFTLIELLVTILVLGTLASIAVLSIRSSTVTSQETACEQQYDELATVVSVYVHQVGAAPADEQDLLDAHLLRRASEWYDVGPVGDIDPQAAPKLVCTYDPDG